MAKKKRKKPVPPVRRRRKPAKKSARRRRPAANRKRNPSRKQKARRARVKRVIRRMVRGNPIAIIPGLLEGAGFGAGEYATGRLLRKKNRSKSKPRRRRKNSAVTHEAAPCALARGSASNPKIIATGRKIEIHNLAKAMRRAGINGLMIGRRR